MNTFRDAIRLWPTVDTMAIEIGVGIHKARHWFARDRIPGEYWLDVVEVARAKGMDLTVEDLARFARKTRKDTERTVNLCPEMARAD